ncbi:MAG: FKBP-type peptidyl-prolyl cis-trans isomerase [Candidatus Thiodiazotropha sp. DIVDIV]
MKLKPLILAVMALCLTHNSYAIELKTQNQKYSYAVGLQIGQMLVAQEATNIDTAAFAAAVSDFLEKKQPQLTQEEMQTALKAHFQKIKEAKAVLAQENLDKGNKYREENAKRDGVTVLENGLQYEVLTPGDGASPKAEDNVEVHYTGTLINGTMFDSSHSRGKPTQFSLNGVVPGFREAISRMQPGAKWRVVMPPELAYGVKGAGKKIGPNETLIFQIEYLGLATPPKTK